MNNRAAAAAFGADAAAGGAPMPPLNPNVVPAPPRGGNELANPQSQVSANQDRREEVEEEEQNQQNQINQGLLGCVGDLRQQMQQDRSVQEQSMVLIGDLRQQMQQDRSVQEQSMVLIGDLQRTSQNLQRTSQDLQRGQVVLAQRLDDHGHQIVDNQQRIGGLETRQAEQDRAITRTARKQSRHAKMVEEGFKALGLEMALSSPDSAVDSAASADETETGK